MAERVHSLVVDTYEEDNPVPVVTHIFHGTSRKQALSFYKAHLKADRFLAGCEKGRFKNFRCRNVVRGWA